MKRFFLLLSVSFLISCGSDSPLVGKWKNVFRGGDVTVTEICEFNKKGIENCTSTWVQRVDNGTFEAHRLLTQEWTLANGQITEKTTNGQVLWMALNGQEISPSDPIYRQLASNLMSDTFNTGFTVTRKIELHENHFILYGKKGKPSRFDRIN